MKQQFMVLCFIMILSLLWIVNFLCNINQNIKNLNIKTATLINIADETKKTCNRDYNKLLKINKLIWQ